MNQVGSGFFFLMAVIWTVVPIAAGVWALVTLHRMRMTQEAIRATLASIDRRLERT